MLSHVVVISVFVLGMTPTGQSRQFPLSGCSKDEMDVLFLYFDTGGQREREYQKELSSPFANHLSAVQNNTRTGRVLFADVYDTYSANQPDVDFRSLNFSTPHTPDMWTFNDKTVRKQQYKNIQEIIKLKIKLVQRLFSEMGGVRENVTHIAVVFLDGTSLSYPESRRVPQIVDQQDTEIKIFVVVLGGIYDNQLVYLNDTLLVIQYTISKHVLTMAICNQCMEDWFSFLHSHTTDSLSCYKLLDATIPTSSSRAREICRTEGGYLAAIETEEELNFLMESMLKHLNTRTNRSDVFPNFPLLVHMGLYIDWHNVDKIFYWALADQHRPVVVNNWIPGKPSKWRSNRCGVWQFDRSDVTNVSNSNGGITDGWADIECEENLSSLSLCEVVLPRRIEDKRLKIKHAINESFKETLKKGDFELFKENIVSVSAYVASAPFRVFLKEKNVELFPLFDCGLDAGDNRYVSYVYVCDNIDHCSNKRDETFCLLTLPSVSIRDEETCTKNCNGQYCSDGSCSPLQSVNANNIDCSVCGYSKKYKVSFDNDVLNEFLNRTKICDFMCKCGSCVYCPYLSDGHIGCKEAEGRMIRTFQKQKTTDACYKTLQRGISAPRCVYMKDTNKDVLDCRLKSHLNDCTNFTCLEGYFKCPNAYCIPQHYVLDFQVDCPTGEEEQNDVVASCSENFACWKSDVCLHPNLVCDGHPDCPHQDDEIDCRVPCADGFRCVSGTITVLNYDKTQPLKKFSVDDNRTRYIDFTGLDLSNFTLPKLENIIFIILSQCKINNFYDRLFHLSRRVQKLDVSRNLIQELDGREIYHPTLENLRHLNLSYNRHLSVVENLQFKFLETLDISHTDLSHLDQSMLKWLPNLKHLNLSFSVISDFLEQTTFPNGFSLQTLDIRGLPIKSFRKDFFHDLTVGQHLHTDRFELCCSQIRGPNIPYYTCHAPGDAISSCSDLLGVNVQRVLLWVVAVLAVLGNTTVIAYRLIWDRSILRTGYGLFVTNLGISDFIMGVYLFIIAGADFYYRGIYVLYDKIWRESLACRFAGFLATLSCETSTFFVFLITLDRFLVVKFPFGQKKFTKISKLASLLLSWVTGFLIALIPIVFKFEIYSSNAMCLGLPLTTKLPSGWKFSFGVYIVINFLIFIIIAYGQRAIFQAISENRITTSASSRSPRRNDDVTVAKQLSLVVLSNFLCWFPVGVMGLLSFDGYEISKDVYAWTTVIVLPINSAANPLLYTIPTLISKWKTLKI